MSRRTLLSGRPARASISSSTVVAGFQVSTGGRIRVSTEGPRDGYVTRESLAGWNWESPSVSRKTQTPPSCK
jgi:hypothetical protein